MSTSPVELTIPAPRGAAEPTGTDHDRPRGVREEPGWLTMIEALDGFASSLVARYEHEMTRAAAEEVPRLRRQAVMARRLEATTAAAAAAARHTSHPQRRPRPRR